MSAYLITGISGSGKSAVARRLAEFGYAAIDADSEIAGWVDKAGRELARPEGAGPDWLDHHDWEWSHERLSQILAAHKDHTLFICGNANNQFDFFGLFSAIFLLNIDAETMLRRIDDPARDNDFGRSDEQRQLLLNWLPYIQIRLADAGAVVVDGTAPLDDVVDAIRALVGRRQ